MMVYIIFSRKIIVLCLNLRDYNTTCSNKECSEHPFVDFGKHETSAKFKQKLLKSAVVGACQSNHFEKNFLVSRKQ